MFFRLFTAKGALPSLLGKVDAVGRRMSRVARDKSNSLRGSSGNETDYFSKTENERKGHSLLRFPKSLAGLERRGILTAAPSSPRFIRHRRHFGDDALRRAETKLTVLDKLKIKGKVKTHPPLRGPPSLKGKAHCFVSIKDTSLYVVYDNPICT